MASKIGITVLHKRARQLQYDPHAMYVVLSNEPPFRVDGYQYSLYEVVPHWEWVTSSALYAMGKIGECPQGTTPLFKKVTRGEMKSVLQKEKIDIDAIPVVEEQVEVVKQPVDGTAPVTEQAIVTKEQPQNIQRRGKKKKQQQPETVVQDQAETIG